MLALALAANFLCTKHEPPQSKDCIELAVITHVCPVFDILEDTESFEPVFAEKSILETSTSCNFKEQYFSGSYKNKDELHCFLASKDSDKSKSSIKFQDRHRIICSKINLV